MNARFPHRLAGTSITPPREVAGVSPLAPATSYSVRISRVSGEAFDADQLGWSCEECGLDEYTCDCELPENDDWPVNQQPMSMDEVRAQIARVFGTKPVVTDDEGGARVGL